MGCCFQKECSDTVEGDPTTNPLSGVFLTKSLDSTNLDVQKKELMEKIEAWKADFKRKNDREPTQSDIEADCYGSALFREYTTLLENSGSSKPNIDTQKELMEKIEAWKADFKRKNDREPTQSDIEADCYGAALFREYTTLLENSGSSKPNIDTQKKELMEKIEAWK
eukprot:Tbor_TRINITY_DN5764_c7_g1::TRINITY_DN5764_c7_g1_i5::g.20280::m.20280